MIQIRKAAIVCCSNGQDVKYREKTEQLCRTLLTLGIEVVLSDHIYADKNGFCGTAEQRAESLMKFYKDSSVDAVFDISGGDLANEILPLLDYEIIAASKKRFWGYSDLTTILNAVYTKTGKTSVLYQVRNLISSDSETQICSFSDTVLEGKNTLYDIAYSFVQGEAMTGVLVGGNIRCLLKLAGTQYWPDMQDKILLLESCSGNAARMITYLSQLKQMGVFEKIKGILLGTFTEMDKNDCVPKMEELVLQFVGPQLPVAVTKEIGHGSDSKAVVIGEKYSLKRK